VKKKNKSKGKKDRGGKKGNVDFTKYLKGLNRGLEKAKERAAEGGFEEFDDGRYKMKATDAKIGVSKNKRVQVIITWKFMSGEYKGKEKLDFEGLVEDHLEYLLRKLDAMGYDTSSLENLDDDLKEILTDIKKSKPECRVRLKTKGEFQNVYVDGLLGDGDDEDDEDEEDDESESDDDDDEEDDEDEDDKKKSKKKSKKKKDDDEDEDEEEDDDDDEDSEDDEEESDDDDDDEEEDDDDEEDEKPKKGKKKKGKKDDDDDEEEDDSDDDEEDEDEEEDDDDDEIDVVVGSVVKGESKKSGKFKGEVVELFEKDGKVLIKTDKGKTLKVKADTITSVEEAPASSVKSKKKKKGKK
jgi:hypothetical protein